MQTYDKVYDAKTICASRTGIANLLIY